MKIVQYLLLNIVTLIFLKPVLNEDYSFMRIRRRQFIGHSPRDYFLTDSYSYSGASQCSTTATLVSVKSTNSTFKRFKTTDFFNIHSISSDSLYNNFSLLERSKYSS
jgi:hypothetical protein